MRREIHPLSQCLISDQSALKGCPASCKIKPDSQDNPLCPNIRLFQTKRQERERGREWGIRSLNPSKEISQIGQNSAANGGKTEMSRTA